MLSVSEKLDVFVVGSIKCNCLSLSINHIYPVKSLSWLSASLAFILLNVAFLITIGHEIVPAVTPSSASIGSISSVTISSADVLTVELATRRLSASALLSLADILYHTSPCITSCSCICLIC